MFVVAFDRCRRTPALALVVVASAGLTQSTASQRIDELTVQRLNVVDGNGTLRVVLVAN